MCSSGVRNWKALPGHTSCLFLHHTREQREVLTCQVQIPLFSIFLKLRLHGVHMKEGDSRESVLSFHPMGLGFELSLSDWVSQRKTFPVFEHLNVRMMCVHANMILMFLTALWSYRSHLELPGHFWLPFSSQAPAFVLSLLGTDLVPSGYHYTSFCFQLLSFL